VSTITAVGPALDLDGPLPVTRPHSLLSTPGVVVDRDAGRWLNGVNLYPYPIDTPSLWEPCASDAGEGTFRTKAEPVEQPGNPRFDSFVVYVPVMCSAIGMGPAMVDEFAGRAEAVLEATLSMGVEAALASGIVGSTNSFFGDANVNVLNSGTAVSPKLGLRFLEEAIGSTGRGGMIHSTPAVTAGFNDDPVETVSPLVTINGTPVVSGTGYQDVDTPFLAAPGATEDWIFATGPVEVRLGPLVITDLRETLDRSDNTLVFRAERYVLAVWDTALQSAVLVDWSCDPCNPA
jgi:hypothetical protein